MKRSVPEKGQYGYRDHHKKQQFLLIFFGVLAILLQLGARRFTQQDAFKNILTVMAILSVLPVANLAAPFLASFRYRTPGPAFYEKLSPYGEQMAVLYDLIITSKELIMPMDGVLVHPLGVFFYCSDPKIPVQKAEAFLNDRFRTEHLDPHAKVFTDEKAFFKRASSLKPSDGYEDDGSMAYTIRLLKSLSM